MILRVSAVVVLVLAGLCGPGSGPLSAQSVKDDDFAEFEDDDSEFDFEVLDDEDEDDEFEAEENKGAGSLQDDELDDDDFDQDFDQDFDDVNGHLEEDEESFEADIDEDEFEKKPISTSGKIDIELSESAVKIGPIWKTYVLEMIVVSGMVIYLLNYFIGRAKNSSMAKSWYDSHEELLRSNFAVVGDSGEGDDITDGELVKVCDDSFTLWCSGRANCTGLLVHMQFCRRHDLMAVVYQLVQPKKDLISLIFKLGDEDEMDSFVLAIGAKKTLQKMQKEYEDLKSYTSSIRPLSKAEPLFFLSEIAEATQSFLSERNCTFLAKHASSIDSIHITDQYTGYVQDTDDSEVVVVRKPEKRIIVNFYATSCNKEGPFLKFALQALDQVRNMHLSREAREKAGRKRTKVSAELDKLQHTQRQEAAQQRREEKVRARKEKTMLLSESDPEKARKLEVSSQRRLQLMNNMLPKSNPSSRGKLYWLYVV